MEEGESSKEKEKSDEITIKIPKFPKLGIDHFRSNPWVLSTIVLVVLVLMLLVSSFQGINGNVISENDAKNIIIDSFNAQSVGDFEIVSVEDNGNGFYKVKFALNGKLGGVYVTKDGKNIVQNVIPVSKVIGNEPNNENNGNSGLADIPSSSFKDTGDGICTDEDGKPYIILFSTTWCPHCKWVKDTFDGLVDETFANKVNIQHWEIDTNDNTLTPQVENEVPEELMSMYENYNPEGTIPTYIFGCKYFRKGNGYEGQDDLEAELADFKLIIGKLLE